METPRRKRHKPWVFIYLDHWRSARIRLLGDNEILRQALLELAETFSFHNPPGSEPLIGGVALVERSLDEGEAPRILAAYYGPGDPRNTVVSEAEAQETKPVVREPPASGSAPLRMAARGLSDL